MATTDTTSKIDDSRTLNIKVSTESTAVAIPTNSDFLTLLSDVVSRNGVQVNGKAAQLAVREKSSRPLTCVSCGRKIHNQSSVIQFVLTIEDGKTQHAAIECKNVICGDCIQTDESRDLIRESFSRKSHSRARPCARNAVGCFAPLLRLCCGDKSIRKLEKGVDVIAALLMVVVIGLVIYFFVSK